MQCDTATWRTSRALRTVPAADTRERTLPARRRPRRPAASESFGRGGGALVSDVSSLFVFGRQRSGSVVCVSCGYLVGVNDDRCYHCGRRNPGLWGFAPVLRRLGHDLGFVPFVIGTCVVMYVLTLLWSGRDISGGGFEFF